jgi:hypothetical protein
LKDKHALNFKTFRLQRSLHTVEVQAKQRLTKKQWMLK